MPAEQHDDFTRGVLDCRKALKSFAFLLAKDRDRAEDLVQETTIKALTKRHLFQEGTNLRSWLFTIMRYHYFSQYRKSKREVSDPDGILAGMVAIDGGQEYAFDLKVMLRRIRMLTPEYQRIMIMVGIQRMSYEEVAALEGVPLGTIKSRMNRARAAMGIDAEEEQQPPIVVNSDADLVTELYVSGKSIAEIMAALPSMSKVDVMGVILDRNLQAPRQ